MSLRRMPSPLGTNRALRFILDRSLKGAAYDEAPNDAAMLELLEFLRGKLSEEDLGEFCRIAGIDQGMTMDEPGPVPFKGMPQPGGKLYGQDSASYGARLKKLGLSEKAVKHVLSIRVNS